MMHYTLLHGKFVEDPGIVQPTVPGADPEVSIMVDMAYHAMLIDASGVGDGCILTVLCKDRTAWHMPVSVARTLRGAKALGHIFQQVGSLPLEDLCAIVSIPPTYPKQSLETLMHTLWPALVAAGLPCEVRVGCHENTGFQRCTVDHGELMRECLPGASTGVR